MNATNNNNNNNKLTNAPLFEYGNIHRQTICQSVSWNSTGSILASSSTQGVVKIWSCPSLSSFSMDSNTKTNSSSGSNSNSNSNKELTTLDHRFPVERVRFHPTESTLLCTNVKDRSIQLWDVRTRGNQSKSIAKIDLQSNVSSYASSVEWMGGDDNATTTTNSKYLAVTEKNDSVYIYDIRKLQRKNTTATTKSTTKTTASSSSSYIPVHSFHFAPHFEVTETHFSPSGTHLISAVRNGNDNMGSLIVYPLLQNNNNSNNNDTYQSTTTTTTTSNNNIMDILSSSSSSKTFIAHTGKIYSMKFSPNGQGLATGGNDALVGLWDVPTMVCTSTISRRSKFIRSVSYSHDSKLVASCTEEDGVDISIASSGELLCNVNLTNVNGGFGNRNNDRRNFGYVYGGADEIAFHPTSYLLACARGDDNRNGGGQPQIPEVTIVKIPDIGNNR